MADTVRNPWRLKSGTGFLICFRTDKRLLSDFIIAGINLKADLLDELFRSGVYEVKSGQMQRDGIEFVPQRQM